MKSICNKCSHFKTCEKSCYPVKKFLYEKGEVYERNAVVYPLHKHVQHSACLKPSDEDKVSEDNIFYSELYIKGCNEKHASRYGAHRNRDQVDRLVGCK